MSRRHLARYLLGRWRWTITRAVESSLLNNRWREYFLPHWSPKDLRVSSNLAAVAWWAKPTIVQLQLQLVSQDGAYTRSTQEKLVRGRRAYLLSDVIVEVSTAIPWNESGWILGDASLDLEDMRHSEAPRGWGSLAHQSSNGLTVVAPTRDNYFHYLIEDLPGTLKLLELYPDAHVLVPVATPDWILASLREIGIQPTVASAQSVALKSYAAVTRQAGHPTSEEIQTLRAAFRPNSILDHAHGKRIFVCRRGYGRRPSWEESLIKELTSQGFLCVEPSQLSVLEQVNLFGGARHIVGFGGAALTNMVWMPEGGRVTIIDSETRFADSVYNWLWPRLAAVSGHQHELILLDHVSGPDQTDRLMSMIKRAITNEPRAPE